MVLFKDHALSHRIIKKNIIFTHTNTNPYSRSAKYNFNHAPNIIRVSGDKLLVAWFSGPWEGHHWQRILCSCSHDDGNNWSPAKILQDTRYISDFDPAFIQKNNRIFLFHSLARWWEPKLAGEKRGFLGTFIRFSDNNGKTWSKSQKVSEDYAQRANGINLINGDLIIGCYSFDGHCAIIKSTDNGDTWKVCGDVAGQVRLTEPTVVALSNGKLLMMIRSTDGYIWASQSSDNGEKWSIPYKTEIMASNASHALYRIRDGRIALSYNPCKPRQRSRLVLSLSEDDGLTWQEPILIDEIKLFETERRAVHPSGADHAVSYPSICEDSLGNLVVIWSRYRITKTEHIGDIHLSKLSL